MGERRRRKSSRATGQASRWLTILELLAESAEGLSVAQLAVELNATPRTIYRDLEAIQAELREPLVGPREQPGSGEGRWKFLDATGFRSRLPFSPSEMFALLAARELLKPLTGTPFALGLRSLYDKLRHHLPEPVIGYIERASQTFVAGAGPSRDHREQAPLLEMIQNAIRSRHTLEMRYRSLSSNTETDRRLDPYRLWYADGSIYAVGRCHVHGDVRTFAVHRMLRARATDESFALPKDFRWDDFTRDSFRIFRGRKTRVVIDFRPSIAPLIRERPWHRSQSTTELPDGGVRLTMEVAGLFEVTHWIAGFGTEARVVEPSELVDHFRRQAAELTAAYAKSGREDLRALKAAREGRG